MKHKNIQRITSLFTHPLVSLILALAFLLYINIQIDNRNYSDIEEMTLKLTSSGMQADQVNTIRHAMFDISRNVSSYIWLLGFCGILFANHSSVITKYKKDQKPD